MRQMDEMDNMQTMKSAFHVQLPFTILFEELEITTTTEIVGSCLVLASISFLLECLKSLRGILNAKQLVRESSHEKQGDGSRFPGSDSLCECKATTDAKPLLKASDDKDASCAKVWREKFFQCPILLHAVDCLLFGIHLFMSYALMLSAMSFHTGVIISIVLGAVAGRVLLAWPRKKRIPSIQSDDGCH